MSESHTPSIYLPQPLVDTHFHALNMAERGLNPHNLLERSFRSGLAGALEVAVCEAEFGQRRELARQFGGLRLSAGIHPSQTGPASSDWSSRFEEIRAQADCEEVAAIGETGLDFFRDYSPRRRQEDAFRDHLLLAAEAAKPVIVHNRAADERVIEIVKESRCRSGVLHCFSADWETARAALDLGFFISFAGNVTYRNASAIRDAAARVPPDRILAETDAPYLSPQEVRGRVNHPGHLGYTFEVLAEIRGADPVRFAEDLRANAGALFGVAW